MYEVYVKKRLSLQKYCQTLRVLYIATYFDRQVLFEHRVNNLSISLDIMGGEKGILNNYSARQISVFARGKWSVVWKV